MLIIGERFRKVRLTAAAILYAWLMVTILVFVGQFFYYTSEKQLGEVNKQVKISTYISFSFDYVGSGNLIRVKPFGDLISSTKWLAILANKSPQEYSILKNEWQLIVCSPGISAVIIFLLLIVIFIYTKFSNFRNQNERKIL